jgi:hypothetical protein
MGKRSPESSSYQNSLPAAPRINMVHEEFESEDLFNMCISFLNPSVEILRLGFRIWPFRCTVEPKQTLMTEKKKPLARGAPGNSGGVRWTVHLPRQWLASVFSFYSWVS